MWLSADLYLQNSMILTWENSDMALQTGSDLVGWESMFIKADIYAASAKIYAQTFFSEEITRDSLHMLDCTYEGFIK